MVRDCEQLISTADIHVQSTIGTILEVQLFERHIAKDLSNHSTPRHLGSTITYLVYMGDQRAGKRMADKAGNCSLAQRPARYAP